MLILQLLSPGWATPFPLWLELDEWAGALSLRYEIH